MKKLLWLLVFVPAWAFASVSGVDDINPNLPPETLEVFDEAFTTYYQEPSRQKVEEILDLINNTELLRKKTAWPPIVGFLTVVFEKNQKYLFSWMGRNDYNSYAQDIFVTSLLHAHLNETALVFVQAHQWKPADIERVRQAEDKLDLKHLNVITPSHIDTLWGAFFGSGDIIYVNEVIDQYLRPLPTMGELELEKMQGNDSALQIRTETKKLAESTLRQYAASHDAVKSAVRERMAKADDENTKHMLQAVLPQKK